jgi:DNA polymerase IV
VAIKVRYAPFFTHTRSLTLDAPTIEAETITTAALSLTEKLDRDRPIRLLGVRVEMPKPP